ncbi:GVQW3 protein, partial [Pseudoatta argentina]
MEQRAVIKFNAKLGKNASETFRSMQQVYGSQCLGRTAVFEWHKRFLEGRETLEDDVCLGIWKRRLPCLSRHVAPSDYHLFRSMCKNGSSYQCILHNIANVNDMDIFEPSLDDAYPDPALARIVNTI